MKCHIRYVEVFWGSKETISGPKSHFSPLPAKSKTDKIAQKSILAPNSKSCRVADGGRNDDIWPEMGS